MKTPRVVNAVEHIDDDLVVAAAESKNKTKHNLWIKWGSIAACFVLVFVTVIGIVPNMLSVDEPIPPITPIIPNNPENEGTSGESAGGENVLEKYYSYEIDEGKFSAYIGGKVIAEEKVGNKISNVYLTAGWKNSMAEWISTENLNGEVYLIDGVSEDIAVALKFIDQGEAITTIHYYVIMNPDADLTVVEDYVIAPTAFTNNAGNEIIQEDGAVNGDETVSVTTDAVRNEEIPE